MTKKQKERWAQKLAEFNHLMYAVKIHQEKFLADARKAKCYFGHPEDIPLMVSGITDTKRNKRNKGTK